MKIGVLVGRFQIDILHEGHKDILFEVCKRSDYVIVFLGNSQSITKRNPLSYDVRAEMLAETLKHFRKILVYKFNFTIVSLDDNPNDEEWFKDLEKKIEDFNINGEDEVTLYGSRDSFLSNIEYKGKYKYELINVVFDRSSTARREYIKEMKFFPTSEDFRTGCIYSVMRQYDKIISCVDGAIVKIDGVVPVVLLGRRKDSKYYRFPGGHVDITDNSNEDAIIREIFEETGIVAKNPKYVCSTKIDDWRNTPDSVYFTTLYTLEGDDTPKISDELCEFQWFNVLSLSKDVECNLLHFITPEHHILCEKLYKIYNDIYSWIKKEKFNNV